VTTTEPFSNMPTGGVPAANQGNPFLAEEKGDSYTLGVVVQPRMVPGLSFSVDYYDITIKDAIFTLTPQVVIEQCYDSTSGIDNPFCKQVNRLPNGTFAGQIAIFHAGGQTVSLNNPGFSSLGGGFNYANFETSGIDAQLNYRRDVFGDVELAFNGIVSYLIKRDAFTDILDPDFRNRIKSELGDPEWRGQATTRLDFGRLALQHKVQYIGKQILNLSGSGTYETFFPLDGRAPLDPDAAPQAYYKAKWYNDLRAELDVNDRFRAYVGVDNVFDVRPPLDLLGTEAGSLYDPTGRFFYAGVRVNF
jgi:outer membrane receptor protein involved in Fe transport